MSVEIRQETKRSVNARALLLDAAEMLFAQRGIDGVSLRQIAASAGQRNVSAVRYHFGDKQGLVDALVADRLRHCALILLDYSRGTPKIPLNAPR